MKMITPFETDLTHFKFVVPSYYNNANLNTQKGIVSYWEIDDKNFSSKDEIDRRSLNVLIENSCQHDENHKKVLLYKYRSSYLSFAYTSLILQLFNDRQNICGCIQNCKNKVNLPSNYLSF